MEHCTDPDGTCRLVILCVQMNRITSSFNQNVPLQVIRACGAWVSDVIWQYVKHTNQIMRDSHKRLLQHFHRSGVVCTSLNEKSFMKACNLNHLCIRLMSITYIFPIL